MLLRFPELLPCWKTRQLSWRRDESLPPLEASIKNPPGEPISHFSGYQAVEAPKPARVRRQSALEVRASSQTKLSRGLVRPAQEQEELTALAADTSQAVSRCVHETGGEESSRCLMRSQNVVPCVGRARAREPHTKDTEEEATGDGGRGSLGDGLSNRVAECTVPRPVSPVS